MLIKIPRGWELPEREATLERVYWNQRQVLQSVGFFGAAGLLAAATAGKNPYPAKRNTEFKLDRAITAEWAAESYNNFYEFD